MKTFIKQPYDRLDYDFDFSKFLEPGDMIESAECVADPGIAVDSVVVFEDGLGVKVWVSGGESGGTYHLTVRVVTDYGRAKEVDAVIAVVEIGG